MAPLSRSEQVRLVHGIGRALAAGSDIDDTMLLTALRDILVREQWPEQRIIMLCGLERRKINRTTDPGGVDGPPFDRPMANNQDGIDPEQGARQGGDPDSPGSGRELPP